MKTLVLLSVLLAVVVARPGDTYNPRYDSFNAQELVENDRLLKSYGKCFLGKGPCTKEGSDFKKIIPEALRTSCGKCTVNQRKLIRTVVRGFQSKLPDIWTELVHQHDPEGQYKTSFEAFLRESN